MIELLNVLYVLTQGAMLRLEHDTVRVEMDGETHLRAPLLRLGGIVVFGRVMLSPALIQRCAEDGRSLVWLDQRGRFKARLEGETRGNVLLRRAQHLALSDPARTARIARQIVAAKVQNSRQVLLRAAREADAADDRAALTASAGRLADGLERLKVTMETNAARGIEGDAAAVYFGDFRRMIRRDQRSLSSTRRTRRPPRDALNAALSFTYALVRAECASALEEVGLDPQVGFLHALRPGRPSLALDLMEEFRPVMADRLVLTLLNRLQLGPSDFESYPGGAVLLSESGRRTLVVAYQRRKEQMVQHRVLKEKVPLGLVPHVQARLLARHLRGDLPDYPPFLYR